MIKKNLLFLLFLGSIASGFAQKTAPVSVRQAQKKDATTVEIDFNDNHQMIIDFYGENIFRMFQDNNNGILRDPEANPPARILVNEPRKPVQEMNVKDNGNFVIISTDNVKIEIDKATSLMKIGNTKTGKTVLESLQPFDFTPKSVTWRLKAHDDEYFFGGGVQNGRFSHKGKIIKIENENSWTDGGVASPNPFYWSTNGYGILWHTFKKGTYDFGSKDKNTVAISHNTDYLDLFVMVDNGATPLLNDYYQLTGNPVLLPKFGFYEGHLNAYNRDYWSENPDGILFEDGKKYKESQKDNGGIKESLNGELNNYQFSARAVIDRYKMHDMPLGWLLPNDGYGAGYGQTETLDGNIANLKLLGEYARRNGVEIGLWTQSDLHPKEGVSPLLQRDIVKEVRDAGVRVLKTDVAWVGAGYSFGLNGVADVAQIMTKYGNGARPFIITLDGWAGTQRYAGIWTGDQTGGVWEYIRFHIPTYIGSGLSGNPNICSDMDGIFGGKNPQVNVRDFQWKTFTPMQLNMDGWGSNPKYPHILGEPSASINRLYLKLKSELMPYIYSIAHEAVNGLPMVRAMFLEYPNNYTLGKSTQYQFLFGPSFLVAPIYQNTQSDHSGNDIRNGIYLPAGIWYDYFTGNKYIGNKVINDFDAPLWKLPLFVKAGAIIPMTNPNNNVSEIDKGLRKYEIYPYGINSFYEYDDDGQTIAYLNGDSVVTKIISDLDSKNKLTISFDKAQGSFAGFVPQKRSELYINVSKKPGKIVVKKGNKSVKLQQVHSEEDFDKAQNAYFYNDQINLNRFATKGSEFEKVVIAKNPQLWIKIGQMDIVKNSLKVQVYDVEFDPENRDLTHTGTLSSPSDATVTETNSTAYSLKPTWKPVANADYYEIDFQGMLYSTIKGTELLFENLNPETKYEFRLRSVNKSGTSDWTTFNAQTKNNPLEFALHNIAAATTCQNQEGEEIEKLFDFDESSMWHTDWSNKNAVPFDIILDLKSISQLDKLQYLPRTSGLNGVLYHGSISVSNDKTNWTKAGDFAWEHDNNAKEFVFETKPTARYIKISVDKSVGGYGSGREMYIFKVPGTESYLPGDINNDKIIDMNDFTSYLNYTGLRNGDADFEGYVSKGDLNRNGLIDAYDISAVATQLQGGISDDSIPPLGGQISIESDKKTYKAGETVKIIIHAKNLQSVNAFSFALAYNPKDFDYVGIEPLAVKRMENMTNDRLHTNGIKSLYPTFVNIGNKPSLNGSSDLLVIKLKAKRAFDFNLKPTDIILVDKNLNSISY